MKIENNIVELKSFSEPIVVKKNDFLIVKEMPYKDKLKFIKSLFEQVGCLNAQVIVNLAMLLKRNKSLSKEVFERDDIFYNSYIELLDVKQDLRKEISEVRKIILTLYYSSIRSISMLNMEESNNIYNLYFLLLNLMTLEDISVISQRVTEDIPNSDIVYVTNGKEIIERIISNSHIKNCEVE